MINLTSLTNSNFYVTKVINGTAGAEYQVLPGPSDLPPKCRVFQGHWASRVNAQKVADRLNAGRLLSPRYILIQQDEGSWQIDGPYCATDPLTQTEGYGFNSLSEAVNEKLKRERAYAQRPVEYAQVKVKSFTVALEDSAVTLKKGDVLTVLGYWQTPDGSEIIGLKMHSGCELYVDRAEFETNFQLVEKCAAWKAVS